MAVTQATFSARANGRADASLVWLTVLFVTNGILLVFDTTYFRSKMYYDSYTFAIPGLFHCPRNDVQWPRDVLSVSNTSESVNSDVGQQLDEEVTLELPMPLIDR